MPSIRAENVNHPGYSEPLNETKYKYIREAILASLDRFAGSSNEGMRFTDLEQAVDSYIDEQAIPRSLFPKPGSVRWYTKSVQLDLEAKDLIERVPEKRPLRFRRK